MIVFILAGGSGTRLWPLSRDNFPKQFIKIGNENLLVKTYKRFLKLTDKKNIYIVTNEKYKFYVINDLSEINNEVEKNIILEPVGRNTTGAIILGIKFLVEKKKENPKSLIFVTPSDHIITDEDSFLNLCRNARKIALNHIVTFGIKPTTPHTGYGYIKRGKKLDGNIYLIEKFTEKPDYKTALTYLESGKYFWNSGMFFFSMGVMLEELKKYEKEVYFFYKFKFDKFIENFSKLKNISIDYSVMEKTKKGAVVCGDFGWSDVGGWESFYEIMPKDDFGNVAQGNVILKDIKNSMIYSNTNRLITGINLSDLIIIDTHDALLVMKKGSGEIVKDIVKEIKEKNHKEAFEHITVYRPWGSYTVLEEGPRYKIKRIFVKPGHKLSEQMHYHRSEHWVVIKGTARVVMDGREYIIHENESIYVGKSTKHQLENPGKVDLELIEVQNGEYVGEDDIVRFNDIYGRR